VLLSPDVAQRVERVDAAYLAARLSALADLPGNPYGAAVLVDWYAGYVTGS
jgi:hypothetical protein